MGKKITADKRDYRKAYVRHKLASEKMDENSRYSKSLLMFYSVECGLKYLLMNKWDIRMIKDIEKDEEKAELLGSHNLKLMLKEVKGNSEYPQGTMSAPLLPHNPMLLTQLVRRGLNPT